MSAVEEFGFDEVEDFERVGDEQTTLYRHFDANGALLYVGISYCSGVRGKQHILHSSWWSEVRSSTHEVFASREEALAAEREAIQAERPKHNIVFNSMKERAGAERGPVTMTRAQVSAFMLTDHLVNFAAGYTVAEAAHATGLSRNYLQDAVKAGELGHFFKSGNPGSYRYLVSGWQLIDFLEKKQREIAQSKEASE